jgi:hypothetical protein
MRDKILITLLFLVGISLVLLGFYGVIEKKEKDYLLDEKELEEGESEQEETSSDPKSVIPIQPGSEFEEMIVSIDTSEKLLDFLNEFEIVPITNWVSQEPNVLVNEKKGSQVDILALAAFILDYQGYETGVIRYNFKKNGESNSEVVTVFRDVEEPKYIKVVKGKVEMSHYGWSFKELFEKEENEEDIKITEYAIFYPGVLDLNPSSWSKR